MPPRYRWRRRPSALPGRWRRRRRSPRPSLATLCRRPPCPLPWTATPAATWTATWPPRRRARSSAIGVRIGGLRLSGTRLGEGGGGGGADRAGAASIAGDGGRAAHMDLLLGALAAQVEIAAAVLIRAEVTRHTRVQG
eukprot:scaffold12841_cov63-Phaeocystis_antarctica.AAC.1